MIIDPKHPFYGPLWRRIAIVLVPAAWGLFEWSMGNTGWALVFAAIAVFAAVVFLRDRPDKG